MKLTLQVRQALQTRAMTPKQYCEKWLPIIYRVDYGERGNRQLCINLLCDALQLKYPTVNAWGADFENYTKKDVIELNLAKQDFINETFQRSREFAAQETV